MVVTMFDNNAAKPVPGPKIELEGGATEKFKLEGKAMSAIKGDEVNKIESMPLKSLADMSDKPLVATGKQVVKAPQSGSKKD